MQAKFSFGFKTFTFTSCPHYVTRAVCASNNDGANVGPTQLTEPRCDCSQCSILEKLNPPTKSDLVRKGRLS